MREQSKKTITAILCAAVIIITYLFGGVGAFAHAASGYTNVMVDLLSDKNFKTTDYPHNSLDFSLQVIQIAESTDGELFVYVYQPSATTGDLRATTVRLSRTKGGSWFDYPLRYISSSGVFYKYVVQDFNVQNSEAERYYEIIAIHRKYDSRYDAPPDNPTQTITETAFDVAQLWQVTTVSGTVTYRMEHTDVVIIKPEDKMVGFRRVPSGGLSWAGDSGACDSHFIAFNSDHKIDDLFEADVSFNTQDYRIEMTGTYQSDPEPQFRILQGGTKVNNKPYGWFGQKYEWERIMRTDDFLEIATNLSDEDKLELKKYSWVLSFYESSYTQNNGLILAGIALLSPGLMWTAIPALLGTNSTGTIVSDVTVLRLNFQTDGVTYNLGVVDNKQTGPGTPISVEGDGDVWVMWLVIAGIAVVAIIILSVLFPPLGKLVIALLKIIFWVISLPFLVIAKLVSPSRKPKAVKPKGPKTKEKATTKKQTKIKAGLKKAGQTVSAPFRKLGDKVKQTSERHKQAKSLGTEPKKGGKTA